MDFERAVLEVRALYLPKTITSVCASYYKGCNCSDLNRIEAETARTPRSRSSGRLKRPNDGPHSARAWSAILRLYDANAPHVNIPLEVPAKPTESITISLQFCFASDVPGIPSFVYAQTAIKPIKMVKAGKLVSIPCALANRERGTRSRERLSTFIICEQYFESTKAAQLGAGFATPASPQDSTQETATLGSQGHYTAIYCSRRLYRGFLCILSLTDLAIDSRSTPR